MNRKKNPISIVIGLLVLLVLSISVPAASAQGSVTATVTDQSTPSLVVVNVSSDGSFKVNTQGNDPNKVLTVETKDKVLRFDPKGTSWQLQGGILPKDESKVWSACPNTTDGWFCLAESVAPAPVAAVTNKPYNLNGETGKYVDCAMWYVNPSNKTMTWTGGGNSVHVCFNEAAKGLLMEGYTAVFTTLVESDVRACRSHWSGADSKGVKMNEYVPSQCGIFKLRAGTYNVNGWAFDPECGVQVGFRVVPVDTAPWTEEKTCETCVWPFPRSVDPTYLDAVIVTEQPAVTTGTQLGDLVRENLGRTVGLCCILPLVVLAILGLIGYLLWRRFRPTAPPTP